MKNKKRLVMINIVSSILLQFLTVLYNFIIPKITLSMFGSDANGLISSLAQFLSYVNLIEGGIGSVVAAKLYKPLVENDTKKLSSVVRTSQVIHRKIAIALSVYSLLLAVVYPLTVSSVFSFSYIFSMTIILAAALFAQYSFAVSYQLLLKSDKKIYAVSSAQAITFIISATLFYLISRICPDLHVLKITTFLAFLFQPIFLSWFVKRHYRIDKKSPLDQELLNSRWDGFAINIAYFIHSSTDVALLTIFTNLATVSVYSVYGLVAHGLRSLILAVSTAITPHIGQLYAKGNKAALQQKFAIAEFVMFALVSTVFTVGGLLITPFVLAYTNNITDANYNQVLFGAILIIAEFLYCIREPYVNLAYSANRFRDIKKHAYIESIINIVVSIILVTQIGLIGVVIGTALAMLYRTVYHVYYLKNHILHRSPLTTLKKFIVFAATSAISVLVCWHLFPASNNFGSVIVSAVIYLTITAGLNLIASAIFFRNELKTLVAS
ncbi:polysaccharide biosynthesis C-terminal domain-containing protein [Candidatus Saccharibacteria bacterium]|nr:polysaccharide biosynthesis C-terminal domain-containing protein [Candidatus Saccharibacteria bacterium]